VSAPFRITNEKSGLRPVSVSGGEEFRSYLERLMKLIPGEVVGLYLIGSGFIPPMHSVAMTIWTIACLRCCGCQSLWHSRSSSK
jgi:hypothetical protein